MIFNKQIEKSSNNSNKRGLLMKFLTKLWKRSQKSFATTIPHIVLLHLNEDKDYNVVWEYNSNVNKWTVTFKEKKNNVFKSRKQSGGGKK